MYWSVDRMEEKTAVLVSADTGVVFAVPQTVLGDVCEGDVLHISVDIAETERLRERNRERLNALIVCKNNAENP